MAVTHRTNILVTTTIEEKGIVFVNFPMYQCACGKSQSYMLGDLEIAEMIADMLAKTTGVNSSAITVDYSKIEPETMQGYEARIKSRNRTMADEARLMHKTDKCSQSLSRN